MVEYTLVLPGGDFHHASNTTGELSGSAVDLLGRFSRNQNGVLEGSLVRYNDPISASNGDLRGTVNNQGRISVTVTPTQSLFGALAQPYTFVASPVIDIAFFNFNRASTLSEVSGNWTNTPTGYTYSVSATTGAIEGRSRPFNGGPGCRFVGSLSSQTTNFYRANFTFGTTAQDGCDTFSLRGVTYTGVGFSTVNRTNQRELTLMLFNLASTDSFAFTSQRPAP